MRSVIFKSDPVRVDFQTVAVLKPLYRSRLEETYGHKTSPLELTGSERRFLFTLTLLQTRDICSRYQVAKCVLFYNWNNWLSCPDPHFHIYLDKATMYSNNQEKFFEIVQNDFDRLFMEETKWSYEAFVDKHHNGTKRKPTKTAKWRHEQELLCIEQQSVLGIVESESVQFDRVQNLYIHWENEQQKFREFLTPHISAMSSGLQLSFENEKIYARCCATFPKYFPDVLGYIPMDQSLRQTYGVIL